MGHKVGCEKWGKEKTEATKVGRQKWGKEKVGHKVGLEKWGEIGEAREK